MGAGGRGQGTNGCTAFGAGGGLGLGPDTSEACQVMSTPLEDGVMGQFGGESILDR